MKSIWELNVASRVPACNLQIVIDRAPQTEPGSGLEVPERGMVLVPRANLSGGAVEMGVEPWSSGLYIFPGIFAHSWWHPTAQRAD